uniref:Uncharacterized protein n=1 Tax=Clastoptera arizonana TaxID=38151 RepID=A0A1B6DX25_9HEMI
MGFSTKNMYFVLIVCCMELVTLSKSNRFGNANFYRQGIGQFAGRRRNSNMAYRRNVHVYRNNSFGISRGLYNINATIPRLYTDRKKIQKERFYRSQQAAVDYLKSRNGTIITEVFTDFFSCFTGERDIFIPRLRRKPFIVIESMYRHERRKVMRMVCNSIEGARCISPPHYNMRDILKKLAYMKLYYIHKAAKFLGLYAFAHLVKSFIVTGHPVVSGSYFTDLIANKINRIYYPKVPPSYQVKYLQPDDLMKPDVIFYLDYMTQRNMIRRKLPRFLQIYLRFKKIGPLKVIRRDISDRNGTVDAIRKILLRHVDKDFNIVSPIT